MFVKTKEVLEDAEALLVGVTPVRSKAKVVQKYCYFPLLYLSEGWNDFSRPIKIFILFSIGILLTLSYSGLATRPPNTNSMMFNENLTGYILVLIPPLLTLFLIPSNYSLYGLTEAKIKRIVDVLDYHDIRKESEIELLEINFERIERRIEGKVKFYNWIIGGSWGFYLIFINYLLRIYGNSTPEELEDMIKESFVPLATFTVVTSMVIICYKRASNILIASLMYACTEQKYRIGKQAIVKETQPSSQPCLHE